MAAPFVLRAPASIRASEQEVAMQGSLKEGTNDLHPQRTHGEYLHHDRPNGIESGAPYDGRPRLSARPGSAPVFSPSSMTTWPLTIT